jgi:hypothetical protein
MCLHRQGIILGFSDWDWGIAKWFVFTWNTKNDIHICAYRFYNRIPSNLTIINMYPTWSCLEMCLLQVGCFSNYLLCHYNRDIVLELPPPHLKRPRLTKTQSKQIQFSAQPPSERRAGTTAVVKHASLQDLSRSVPRSLCLSLSLLRWQPLFLSLSVCPSFLSMLPLPLSSSRSFRLPFCLSDPSLPLKSSIVLLLFKIWLFSSWHD